MTDFQVSPFWKNLLVHSNSFPNTSTRIFILKVFFVTFSIFLQNLKVRFNFLVAGRQKLLHQRGGWGGVSGFY